MGRNLHKGVAKDVREQVASYPLETVLYGYKVKTEQNGHDSRTYNSHMRRMTKEREDLNGKKLARLPDPSFKVVPLDDPIPTTGDFPLLDRLRRRREKIDENFPKLSSWLSHIAENWLPVEPPYPPLPRWMVKNLVGENTDGVL